MFFLSVVSIRTVLAAEMLLNKQGIHCGPWIESKRDVCHLCHLLHYYGVIQHPCPMRKDHGSSPILRECEQD